MKRNNATFALLIICIVLFENANCWRTFWKGRKSGGNVLYPHLNRTDINLPPDQWLTQKLDQFDAENPATWKQVQNEFSQYRCFTVN